MKLHDRLKSKHVQITRIIIGLLLLINLIVHFSTSKPALTIPIPPVTIQKPQQQMRAEYITQTGNTVAFNSVDLVARIPGYLQAINFVDGNTVKKDSNLFVIEPEPYLAQLAEAKASLDAQKAIAAYDKAEYARQQRMYKENATSLNNVEKWLAKSQESTAEVAKAAANVITAQINYSYTQVLSPFDGRIGRHLVDVGNYVGNGAATKLATVEQLDPMYVYFNLNELDLIKLHNSAHQHKYTHDMIKQVPVEVNLQDSNGYKFTGNLDFINTGLNASTGTMEFRALLPNKKNLLVPGLFVNVRIAITKPASQLVVPATAVLYDQIGAYLLLVNETNRVVLRRVVTGDIEAGQQTILSGLKATENVIVNGLQNATPGNQVAPQLENPAS